MPLKVKNSNNLNLGYVYNYEHKNYLVVRSDYEKSKGYEFRDIKDLKSVVAVNIKNFYNEDSTLYASPVLKSTKASSLKIGDFIIQDGLLYSVQSLNNDELTFVDYPASNCPIYFFTPNNCNLLKLNGFTVDNDIRVENKEDLLVELPEEPKASKLNKATKVTDSEVKKPTRTKKIKA
jgi:V8-like Glu-specific endopeptidase